MVNANRLAQEHSPYLLQHAHNPVDWYPWGEAAFERAIEADKPILLSIGYATCHWCHVMAHESFENATIAQRMNEAFVCIKVDREERPDIDNIYMTACQMMTGSGGWPLTLIITPGKKPFFAATYIPPENRFGRIGMLELISRIAEAWNTRRAEVMKSADEITDVLNRQQIGQVSGTETGENLLQAGYDELMQQYDALHGGFGHSPKFPTPHRLSFLMRLGREAGLRAVEHTLEEMRKGGIFDQIGLGFHRYSTDEHWLVPHFEKMLYDQALLALTYTEAYESAKKAFFKDTAMEILTYVQRDLAAPEGGFYSAEDADSEGEEGRFYIWSATEIQSVLNEEQYHFLSRIWNISAAGNYRDEATGLNSGKNIPHLTEIPGPVDSARINLLREKLFHQREKRSHPFKDTKILTDWNGLMIAALAKAARAFGSNACLNAAVRANEFIDAKMRHGEARLWHCSRDGHTAVEGQMDDYAFMIYGLLELYETTLDCRYLERALEYNGVLAKYFLDKVNGGYFMTASDTENLIIRPKELYDGALPSGNSMQLLNLLKLARLTGCADLEQAAVDTGNALSVSISHSPSNFSQALMALLFAHRETMEIVIVGKRNSDETRCMLAHINSVYKPGKVVLFRDPDDAGELAGIAPFTSELRMIDGKTTVYICRNFSCDQPVNSLDDLKKKLI